MTDTAKSFLLILSALFPIVNPLSGAPLFLQLTNEYSSEARRALSWRVCWNSFLLIVGSYFIGSHILGFFGLSLPVVQVGGGLIVVSMGWTVLMRGEDVRDAKEEPAEPQNMRKLAFYPLAMPLTVGPGSISVAIRWARIRPIITAMHVWVIVAALAAMAVIAASVFLCYGFADRLARLLGETGTTVILRLSSFLLLCIGVQIMWNGITGLLHPSNFTHDSNWPRRNCQTVTYSGRTHFWRVMAREGIAGIGPAAYQDSSDTDFPCQRNVHN